MSIGHLISTRKNASSARKLLEHVAKPIPAQNVPSPGAGARIGFAHEVRRPLHTREDAIRRHSDTALVILKLFRSHCALSAIYCRRDYGAFGCQKDDTDMITLNEGTPRDAELSAHGARVAGS